MRQYRHHIYALLGYLVVTFLLTYPLVGQFTQAIPGDGFDGWQNVWNIWWVKHALLVEGTDPYFTRMVDYPAGVHLYFHTLNIFNGLTFLPLTLNAGNLVAYNLAVVFSFVIGGYGTYLLALYVMRPGRAATTGDGPAAAGAVAAGARSSTGRYMYLAAFVGGVIFAFSPYHMAHLLGHMQLISLQWLPFFALFTIIQLSAPPFPIPHLTSRISRLLRYALLAALFLVLVAICDWYYAFYMALFSGLYWLWTLARRRRRLASTLSVAVTGLIFLVVMSPLWIPMVQETQTSDYMVPPEGSTERLSADLTAFFTPSELHPLWGDLAGRWAGRFTASTSERTVFAGYSVLALAVVALLTRRRGAGFWGLIALIFGLLALGPVLHIGGEITFAGIGPVPLPYALLHHAIPLLRISRSVSRFDVVVMLSLAVLAAMGLEWLLSRLRTIGAGQTVIWLVALGAVIVIGLEFLAAPYPMSAPETRPFHYQMAGEPEEFALVDIPMDWDRPANLLYQTVHQKPTVSGYTSRTNPLSPAWRTPVLQTFRYLGPDINSGDPGTLAPTVLGDLDVRYVIVHKTDLPPGDYREETLALVEEVFGEWPVVVDDDWLKVFRVPETTDAPVPYLVLGEGWAPRRWGDEGPARAMAAPTATVLARLPVAQPMRLEIEVYSPDQPTSLVVQVGEEPPSTHQINSQPTVITTSAWLSPGGESLIQMHRRQSAALTVTAIRLVPAPVR